MRYKKSEISVAHIVEAAMRVLARQGYAHTSLMDIANEVGMSKGAVHYHFPTKEALMGQVLQTACDTVATRTRDAWTHGGNPLEALRSAIRVMWRTRAELSDEAKVVADLLAQSLHEQAYERNPGFRGFLQRSGLKFRPHPEFKKADVDARQALYMALAEQIWSPDRLDHAARGE